MHLIHGKLLKKPLQNDWNWKTYTVKKIREAKRAYKTQKNLYSGL